jgi:hypothetical protein
MAGNHVEQGIEGERRVLRLRRGLRDRVRPESALAVEVEP